MKEKEIIIEEKIKEICDKCIKTDWFWTGSDEIRRDIINYEKLIEEIVKLIYLVND